MRPWSGYDLRKWLISEGKFFRTNADQSQIYRILSRMEDSGWISHRVEAREKRPDAKVFSLTNDGRQELLRWARSPYQPPSRFQDADFRVRFVFGGIVDPVGLRKLIVTELEARKHQVATHRGRDRSLFFQDAIPEVDTARANALFELSHRHGMAEIDTWIEWLKETLRELDKTSITSPEQ